MSILQKVIKIGPILKFGNIYKKNWNVDFIIKKIVIIGYVQELVFKRRNCWHGFFHEVQDRAIFELMNEGIVQLERQDNRYELTDENRDGGLIVGDSPREMIRLN